MCGRYTLSIPLSHLVDAFDVLPPEFDFLPRFNIAPTQEAPVIAKDEAGRRVGLLRWGLIPSWAKDPSLGSRMINARAETVAEKPAYRSAFRRRRCLVPADGFFEWKKDSEAQAKKSPKVPFWIHRADREPFAMAGLWERWAPEGEAPLFTYTIITASASPNIRDIHHRMPAILPKDAYAAWLDPSTAVEELETLLAPRGEGLQAYPVSTLVNSPRNDVRECIEPV